MPEIDLEQFASGLDAAMQSHLEWSRRVLRCAVLHTSPGDDVLKGDAHTRCSVGRWFTQHRAHFEEMDAVLTRTLEAEHRAMHDSIRAICSRVLEGKPGEAAELDMFETTQARFIDHLAHFKTLAVTRGSQVDALTGLPLRHRMDQDFSLLTRHTKRHGSALVVMLVDADTFKEINDRHGHAAGDTVLQQLAATLRRALREDDLAYRYGGEEFLLLLEVASPAGVAGAAERVQEAVRALTITLSDSAVVRLTVTIGVAVAAEGEHLAGVIQRADEALYAGKAAGRNCYVVAAEPNSSFDPDWREKGAPAG